MTGRIGKQVDRIVELYEQGLSLRGIARELDCSGQAISDVLRSVGIDPGARRRHQAQVAREIREARYRTRDHQERENASARYEACIRVMEVAERFGVTASTIGQYATKTGPYVMPHEGHRVDAILPDRYSEEGDRIAELVFTAAHPFSPRHLTQYTILPSGRDHAAFNEWLVRQ